jgi:hypothetical protein
MENTFNLYSLDLNKIIKSLKLGEIFQIKSGVSLRALDGEGRMFIEATSTIDSSVVVLNDKVVLDMAQGATGDEFSVDNERYVLLSEGQFFVTKNEITKDNIDKIHNLSEKALELIEDNAPTRPLSLITKSVVQLKNDSNSQVRNFLTKNKRALKISGGILGVMCITLIGLSLVPDAPKGIDQKIVETVPTVKTQAEKLKDIPEAKPISEVDALKDNLLIKRELVKSWSETFAQAKLTKVAETKITLYAQLITESKIEENLELWKNYPDSKIITKYWNRRTDSLVTSIYSKKVKANVKRTNTALLLTHSNILSDKNQKRLISYEASIKAQIRETWVKAVFDPDMVKVELKRLSSLLPENHKLQKSIELKLKAL